MKRSLLLAAAAAMCGIGLMLPPTAHDSLARDLVIGDPGSQHATFFADGGSAHITAFGDGGSAIIVPHEGDGEIIYAAAIMKVALETKMDFEKPVIPLQAHQDNGVFRDRIKAQLDAGNYPLKLVPAGHITAAPEALS
jgi:hypothetical protein